MLLPALAILAAYLVGSIPFGFLIARRHGVDIRAAGSGNIGATNVLRVLGRKLGIVVFALDFLKGALPVVLARLIDSSEWLPVAAGLAALLGHVFPIWLGFRGGKAVATGAGVVTVLLPLATIGALLVFVACVSALRYVALASTLAAAALVALHLLLVREPFAEGQRIKTVFLFAAFLLVLLRHRENIVRIWNGTEHQFEETLLLGALNRVIHVLALAMWFGGGLFFTFVVAVNIFAHFEKLGLTPADERPEWLPLPASFDKPAGTRLAGDTVAPIFPPYFAMQGICGILALITAVGFTRAVPFRRIHSWRFWLVAVALLTLVIAWPLNQHIAHLRILRNEGDAVAKAQFGAWHAASLLLNFATLAMVTAAMALSPWLPQISSEKAK